jgi:hypothetical protein
LVNAGLAAATLTAAANGSSGVVAAVRTGSGAQALVVYFAVLTGYLAYLLLAALPPLHQFASHGVRETTN